MPKKAPTTKKPPAKKVICQLPGADLIEQGKTVEEVTSEIDNDLSPQHDLFCREYIIDEPSNQTRAYMRAYPQSSYGAAAVSAHELLKNPKIIERIGILREDRNKRLEIRADKILRRIEARAGADIRDFHNENGSLKNIGDLDYDTAIAIQSIEIVELFEGRGENREQIGYVKKIKLVDGKSCDELLGRHLKLFTDKVELSGKDGTPIEFTFNIHPDAAKGANDGNKD
jgi:phage terminase small subunit